MLVADVRDYYYVEFRQFSRQILQCRVRGVFCTQCLAAVGDSD